MYVFTTTTKFTFLVQIEKTEVQYLLNAFPIHVNIGNKIMTMLHNNIPDNTILQEKKKKKKHILLSSNSVVDRLAQTPNSCRHRRRKCEEDISRLRRHPRNYIGELRQC